MKTNQLTYLTLLFGMASLPALATEQNTTQKAAQKLVWSCDSQSDPDFAIVDIYKVDDMLVASIYVQTGDGDEADIDFVEVRKVPTDRNDATVTFEQVEGSYPKLSGIKGKPTHKTRGAHIEILAFGDKSGSITTRVAPTGSDIRDDGLDCKYYK